MFHLTMRNLKTLIVFLLLCTPYDSVARRGIPGLWWMTDTPESAWNVRQRCDGKPPAERDRIERVVCQFGNRSVYQAQRAAFTAVQLCQQSFANRRWNCSSSSLPFVARKGSREAAYLQALVSATLTYTIARSCTSGALRDVCGCNRVHQQNVKEATEAFAKKNVSAGTANADRWRWGSCSDNVQHAIRFGKNFSDKLENPATKRGRLALYNNAMGRKVVEDLMSQNRECRCTGITGSCSVKTCWPKVPKRKNIEAKIFDLYDKALRTRYFRKKPKPPLTAKQQRKIPKEGQLVYIKRSPDYCKASPSKGLPGTRGRQCDRDKRGPGGCFHLCCGRGFRTRLIREEKCKCKFEWCCRIVCDNCKTIQRQVDICN